MPKVLAALLAVGTVLLLGLGLKVLLKEPNPDLQVDHFDETSAQTRQSQAPVIAIPSAPLASAASAATPAVAPPPNAATSIGAEGYGPWVQRAINSDHPALIEQALEWLAACSLKIDLETFLTGGSRSLRHELSLTQRSELAQVWRRHEQRCQTLTLALMAQRPVLAQRLVALQWPGAARLLAEAQQAEISTPEERYRMGEALQLALRWSSSDPPPR